MGSDEPTQKLLQDIRDAQREHLAEYRRVTQLSLELQQRAVARQEHMSRMYQRMALVGGVLFVGLLVLLVALLVRWGPYLFR